MSDWFRNLFTPNRLGRGLTRFHVTTSVVWHQDHLRRLSRYRKLEFELVQIVKNTRNCTLRKIQNGSLFRKKFDKNSPGLHAMYTIIYCVSIMTSDWLVFVLYCGLPRKTWEVGFAFGGLFSSLEVFHVSVFYVWTKGRRPPLRSPRLSRWGDHCFISKDTFVLSERSSST